jgi:hypothetical protein
MRVSHPCRPPMTTETHLRHPDSMFELTTIALITRHPPTNRPDN